MHARVVDAWLENAAGERVENVEQGEPIGLDVVVEAREELADPVFAIHVLNADGATVFGFNTTLSGAETARPGGWRPAASASGSRGRSTTRCCPGATTWTAAIFRNRAPRATVPSR